MQQITTGFSVGTYDLAGRLVDQPSHALAEVPGMVIRVKKPLSDRVAEHCRNGSACSRGEGIALAPPGPATTAHLYHYFFVGRSIIVLAFNLQDRHTRALMAQSAVFGSLAIVLNDGSGLDTQFPVFSTPLKPSFGESLALTDGLPEADEHMFAKSAAKSLPPLLRALSAMMGGKNRDQSDDCVKLCLPRETIAEAAGRLDAVGKR
ncbi:MAG: hypothetical protein V4844_03465 [Pseudomonadota bacterium]